MKQANPPKKSLLDALAFANVGHFNAFQALLDGQPRAAAPSKPPASPRSAIVTPIRRMPSAL